MRCAAVPGTLRGGRKAACGLSRGLVELRSVSGRMWALGRPVLMALLLLSRAVPMVYTGRSKRSSVYVALGGGGSLPFSGTDNLAETRRQSPGSVLLS